MAAPPCPDCGREVAGAFLALHRARGCEAPRRSTEAATAAASAARTSSNVTRWSERAAAVGYRHRTDDEWVDRWNERPDLLDALFRSLIRHSRRAA